MAGALTVMAGALTVMAGLGPATHVLQRKPPHTRGWPDHVRPRRTTRARDLTMLSWSLYLLAAAAALGTALAVWHLQSEGRRIPPWALGALHAALGVAGFALLLPVLSGPPRGAALGVAGFGKVAAGFLVLALLTGLLPLSARLRRRRMALPSLVIGLHATLAVSGLVILAAYYAMAG